MDVVQAVHGLEESGRGQARDECPGMGGGPPGAGGGLSYGAA